jgi:hypothetical protein
LVSSAPEEEEEEEEEEEVDMSSSLSMLWSELHEQRER